MSDKRQSGGSSGHSLVDHHRGLLEASAISDEVIAERGYRSATRKTELEVLGFARVQRSVPALVIPIRNASGEVVNYQVRPDEPRIGDDGRPVKYESPAGIPPTLDVPLRCCEGIRSRNVPLWITEGARKADAGATAGLCCVSLPGVWAWARRLNGDARQVLPDLQRLRFEERKVVLAFDSDVMVKREVHNALEALDAYLVSQGALVHFCYLPELEPDEKTGLDDFLAAGHVVEELWEHVEDELRPPPGPKQKRSPALPTAKLLGYVDNLHRRYVHFPNGGEHARVALVLYVLHTWAIDAAAATPYLYVRSPKRRSGKTRLLEVLELPCRASLRAASITEAAIFQAIEAFGPTLLIDEVDAIFASRSERAEAIRGVLNAGNRRGSYVIRGTQDGVPAKSETFGAKVLAGIDTGKLPDTIRDRAIVIHLERRKRDEPIERLRTAELAEELEELRERLGDWAAEHMEELSAYRCEPLPQISDRLEEAWEPLWAIAELAGGEWPQKARAAAIALSGDEEDAREDHGQLLLVALRAMFGAADAMSTKDICAALNEDEEIPFGAYRKGEGIDGRGLANLLRPHGIRPGTIRIGEETAKGYKREQFAEAWARYASESVSAKPAAVGESQASRRHTAVEGGSGEPDSSVTASEHLSGTHPSHGQTVLASQNGDVCDGVTLVTDAVQAGARAHHSEGLRQGDRPPCRYQEHLGYVWYAGRYPRCGICHPKPAVGEVGATNDEDTVDLWP